MTKTYTFTARDGTNPERPLTITLYPEFVRINLTGLWDQLRMIAQAEDKPEVAKSQLENQIQPAALKLLESISGPVHIKDFHASLEESEFSIQIWQRARGLRLAPVNLTIETVDNLDAAEAFIEELTKRQEEANRVARFPGIFDYWFTWIGMFMGFMALFFWPQKSKTAKS
jgi:hypothetical protein